MMMEELNNDMLATGCRTEVVAPTKEGYKRKAGATAAHCFSAHSPSFWF